jgi:hypothetical protein
VRLTQVPGAKQPLNGPYIAASCFTVWRIFQRAARPGSGRYRNRYIAAYSDDLLRRFGSSLPLEVTTPSLAFPPVNPFTPAACLIEATTFSLVSTSWEIA